MANDSITVYTKPACVQCDATKSWLSKRQIPHTAIDVTADADARDFVMALGYSAAPVVVSGGEHWSGFRPDRLVALVAAAA